ncbi:hypothetical protein ACOMHN_022986 [Nucella lapillus]
MVSLYDFSSKYRRDLPADEGLSSFPSDQEESRYVQYRRHIRQTNPARYQAMKQRQRECMKKLRARRKMEQENIAQILRNQPQLFQEADNVFSVMKADFEAEDDADEEKK